MQGGRHGTPSIRARRQADGRSHVPTMHIIGRLGTIERLERFRTTCVEPRAIPKDRDGVWLRSLCTVRAGTPLYYGATSWLGELQISDFHQVGYRLHNQQVQHAQVYDQPEEQHGTVPDEAFRVVGIGRAARRPTQATGM